MSEVVFTAKSGRVQGSPASRRLRLEGQVPAIVYGGDSEPVAVSCNRRQLRAAMAKKQLVGSVVTLEIDGNSSQAVVREVQRHPVRHEVVHIDFQLIDQK